MKNSTNDLIIRTKVLVLSPDIMTLNNRTTCVVDIVYEMDYL